MKDTEPIPNYPVALPELVTTFATTEERYDTYEQRITKNGVKRLYGIDERGKMHQVAVKKLLGWYGFTLADAVQHVPGTDMAEQLSIDYTEPLPSQKTPQVTGTTEISNGKSSEENTVDNSKAVPEKKGKPLGFIRPKSYRVQKEEPQPENPPELKPAALLAEAVADGPRVKPRVLPENVVDLASRRAEKQQKLAEDEAAPQEPLPEVVGSHTSWWFTPPDPAEVRPEPQSSLRNPFRSRPKVVEPVHRPVMGDMEHRTVEPDPTVTVPPRPERRAVVEPVTPDPLENDDVLIEELSDREVGPYTPMSGSARGVRSRSTEGFDPNNSYNAPREKTRKRGVLGAMAAAGAIIAGIFFLPRALEKDIDGSLKYERPAPAVTTPSTVPEAAPPEPAPTTPPPEPEPEVVPTTIPQEEPDTNVIIITVPQPTPPPVIVESAPPQVTLPPIIIQIEQPPQAAPEPLPPPEAVPVLPAEPPVAAPEAPVIPEAFDMCGWPSRNASALGIENPNEFIQSVLDQYNTRYNRHFVWNMQDGMFYEGSHIIDRHELDGEYNPLFLEMYVASR